MKLMHIFTILFCMGLSLTANAQDTSQVKNRWTDSSPSNDKGNKNPLSKEAEFPGGKVALDSFITEKVYEMYESDKVTHAGTVVLKYIVDTAGKVSHVEVLQSLEPNMDDACIEMLRSMPVWTPGYASPGKPRESSFILPLSFTVFHRN